MKILLYGNCQLWGIKETLFSLNAHYESEYIDCYDQDYDKEYMNEHYKRANVIITQPIQDNYRDKYYLSTKYIIEHFCETAKIIIVDSLHFNFYYCDLTYHFFEGIMLDIPEHYHYKFMIDCYKNNITVNDYIKNYVKNIDLLSKEELEKKANLSIIELEKRYEENTTKYKRKNVYFVYTGKYIKNNYKEKLLFYSLNHPTNYILRYISEKIVLILNLKNIKYRFYEIDNAKCIIYNCIQKVVNFNINNCELKIIDRDSGTKKKNIEDICKLYYDTYDRINFN